MSVIQQVALAPRLNYSKQLLRDVMDTLQKCGIDAEKDDDTKYSLIKRQYTIMFCMDALAKVRQALESIRGMDQIPNNVPPTIGVLRAVGVQLSSEFPHCNNMLCELAVHLGSVSMDSALLRRIDIKYSGTRSEDMIKKSRMMAEKKIRKLYPNFTTIPQ